MKYNPTRKNAWKQNAFKNVKGAKGCRENTTNGFVCNPFREKLICIKKQNEIPPISRFTIVSNYHFNSGKRCHLLLHLKKNINAEVFLAGWGRQANM